MNVGTLEGTRLGDRYVLGPVLGRGGMAEVYDATDERLGRPVAVKVLRAALAMNPEVRRRFESEARAAASLAHPNVVTVYDTGEDIGTPYIVMERLPGETLADRMKDGPVDQVWLKRVAGDVLQALAAAHAHGIIHRDVKPGNILIAPDGCAKVTDFGIAKSTENLGGADATATNMLLGTPAYLAPERIHGNTATAESDLYSLGVLLYEALAGAKPYNGSTPMAIARSIDGGAITPLREVRPDVDPVLAHVVERAMAPDPGQRFSTAEEMRHTLEGDVTMVADVAVGAEEADATVASPTTVMKGTAVGAVAAVPPPLAAPPVAATSGATVAGAPGGAGGLDRRVVAALVAGGLLLLLLLVLLAGKLGSGSEGDNPATTVGTSLEAQLRSLAAKVNPSDPPAAQRITSVADLQAKGDKAATAAAATAALRQVTDDHQAGRLSTPLAVEATTLLQQAGASAAAQPTTTVAPPTTAAPPSTVAPAPAIQDGKKGKGKKGD